MTQVWKCNVDTFNKQLGSFNRLAVSVRLDHIKRVHGITEPQVEAQLLGELFTLMDGTPRHSTPRVMLNLAHNMNRQGLYDKANWPAHKTFVFLNRHETYAKRFVERVECLKLISCYHFHQGEMSEAEQWIRKIIGMLTCQWGLQHPWVLEFMTVLRSWLQVWGRMEDAGILSREIERWLKRIARQSPRSY